MMIFGVIWNIGDLWCTFVHFFRNFRCFPWARVMRWWLCWPMRDAAWRCQCVWRPPKSRPPHQPRHARLPRRRRRRRNVPFPCCPISRNVPRFFFYFFKKKGKYKKTNPSLRASEKREACRVWHVPSVWVYEIVHVQNSCLMPFVLSRKKISRYSLRLQQYICAALCTACGLVWTETTRSLTTGPLK